jgi:hypothetical protein
MIHATLMISFDTEEDLLKILKGKKNWETPATFHVRLVDEQGRTIDWQREEPFPLVMTNPVYNFGDMPSEWKDKP